jgi:zinc/manganese transport system substrate-binding protein
MPGTRAVSIAVLVAAVLAAGCSSGSPAPGSTRAVKVVAAENFWGDIAGQIGGSHVAVTSIISDPTADPHQYESDAHDAAAIADARLAIVNGAGYDDFVTKLLAATSHRGRVVLTVADVLHATGSDVNPHLWYALSRIPEVARAIESELAAADPADQASFAANLQTFVDSLAPLEQLVTQIKTKYPHAPVAYTERVPGYLLAAAGLTVASPPGFAQAIEDGNEPSAGDTKTMNDLVSGRRVRVLLYNAQATSPVTQHVQDLARQAGVPVVAVTETRPADQSSYQAWQQHQLQALRTALGG